MEYVKLNITGRRNGHKLTPIGHTLVDADIAERVEQEGWRVNQDPKGYVSLMKFEAGKAVRIKLHRYVLEATADQIVDHISMDVKDNRRSNLRFATRSENQANQTKRKTNKSGYKGVSWSKAMNKWMATIQHERKSIYLGCYEDPADAARAYDEAARRLKGDFARPNL